MTGAFLLCPLMSMTAKGSIVQFYKRSCIRTRSRSLSRKHALAMLRCDSRNGGQNDGHVRSIPRIAFLIQSDVGPSNPSNPLSLRAHAFAVVATNTNVRVVCRAPRYQVLQEGEFDKDAPMVCLGAGTGLGEVRSARASLHTLAIGTRAVHTECARRKTHTDNQHDLFGSPDLMAMSGRPR